MKEIFGQVRHVKTNLSSRKFPDDFLNHIVCGSCVDVMQALPVECVDLVVTSPPYFVEKKYEKNWTLDYYRQLMNSVFIEIYRILKPGRYFVVNFGDYFNKNRFYDSEIPSVYPATIEYFNWGRSSGFDLQATRIWRKKFSRMAIPMVCNTHPRPIFDYEHVWTFRKPGNSGQEFVTDRKKSQRGVIGENWSSGAKIGKHEAAFPIELPEWAISVYSQNRDEVVLDPFCGIGTTLIAAESLHRQYIGIDMDNLFCSAAFNRVQGLSWKVGQ